MQVIQRDPVPPRLLNAKVDPDLETICLKCLEKDPRRRYPSAEALAEDLQRYLNDEAISARSSNVLDHLLRSLHRSLHDVAFHTWSTMVLIIAAIVFLEHVVVYVLTITGQSRQAIMASRLIQFVLIGLLFWRNRRQGLLPTSAAERELWTIWIGYLGAYVSSILTLRILIAHGLIQRGPDAPERWDELILYPFSAIASGLAFFIMGSNYWGRLYAVGLLFFVVAILMPSHLEWAPLEFGALWSVTLLFVGLHLRKLGSQKDAVSD
jgi:hypothetical protein